MSLPAGTRLGPYDIVGPLGEGGMGEVYRARDTRLGRDVAIKILPPRLATDPQAVARFEQEARAVAALSHPNILAIHDVGREGDVAFAVVELLDGKTLRELLTPALPLRKAVDYAQQIAQGLAAAHAKGITHRDLKPENIFVTTDGHVKILDFGLAKLDSRLFGAPASGDQTTTMAAGVKTDAGTVLGTVGYLSPEQAQGRVVDHRTDIFSFGAVLYEMATGTRAFQADSAIDTLHRIVHNQPAPVETACPAAPAELKYVLAKCLAKDPDERYQSTRDLVVDVKNIARALESSPNLALAASSSQLTVPPAPARRRWIVPAVAGAVVVIAIAPYVTHREATAPRSSAVSSAKLSIERITSIGNVIDAAISPDGKFVTYVVSDNAKQGLYVRQLATASTLEIVPPASVGFWGANFSPDGSSLYYALFTAAQPDRTLFRIPSIGGTPRALLTGIDSRPAFSPDGRQIAYVRSNFPAAGQSALMVANADGSDARPVATRTPPDFFSPIFFTAPGWSSDGTFILAPIEHHAGSIVGTLAAVNAKDGTEVKFPHYEWPTIGQALSLDDGAGAIVIAGAVEGRRIAQLWWVSTREASRRQITNDLLDYRTLSVTKDGTSLVTVAADANGSIWTAPIDGGEAQRISTGRYDGISGLGATPDGRVLYRSLETGAASIWIMDDTGANRRQITNEGVSSWPVATPDGKSLVFTRDDSSSLWRADIDGGNVRKLEGPTSGLSPTLTPDGGTILFVSTVAGFEQIWKVPSLGGAPSRVTEVYGSRPAVSPDGKHIALYYQTSADQPFQLAVIPIEGGRPTAIFPVVPSGAFATVRWTADGKALLHNSAIGDRANIWLQPVSGAAPRKVTHFVDQLIFGFDRSADGKKLIISRGVLSRDAVLIKNFR